MELKEFIKAATTDISEAIVELQAKLDNGAIVSPSMPTTFDSKTVEYNGANRLISSIDFNVAITVGSNDSISGNAKAGIQIFAAKINGENEIRKENVSRMTFSVPLIFPTAIINCDRKIKFEEKSQINRDYLRRLHGSSHSGE